MATRPDWMKDAVPVAPQSAARPDWMKGAVPVGDSAPQPVEAPQDGGVMGKVGDFLVDNMIGGVSEDMLDNARTGRFQQDAGKDEGLLDMLGSSVERGAAWVDQGLYNFLGGLGSEKARQAAADLAQGTVNAPIAGKTEWADVNDISSLGKYILGAGAESIPAMGAFAVPYAGPAMITAAQTGNIASERVANNGGGQVTSADLGEAAPWALASTALERIGLKGIKNPVGNSIGGRIAGAASREGLTETAQSGLEYSGGTVGTQAGFDTATALDQMLAGGVAGAGIGAGARGGFEVADPVVQAIRSRTNTQQPGQGEPITETDWEGSLDDLIKSEAEPIGQSDTQTASVPDWMQGAVPVAATGADAETQAEVMPVRPTAPERGTPVDDGVAVVKGIFGDQARVTSGYRGPNHPLSKKNPRSYHARTRAAVDMAPIEGMTFEQAKAAIEAQGYTLIEALNEVGKGRTKNATGDHWHFVIGSGGGAGAVDIPGSSGAVDVPIDVPGADGELLGRGDQPAIARREEPELSGQDWRVDRSESAMAVPQEREPLPEAPEGRRGAISQVTTARGQAVDTQFELRDLPELIDSSSPNYDQALQPRDRAARATSDAQVASIAANLDPAQLADSRLASTGAPIIGPDGQVESGNGRVAAIARAYQQNPERAQAYRQMIEAQGLDTTGMERPVLVRRRTTDMTPEQRQQWTRAANERDTMAMSSTEQAAADARALPDATLALYRGGPITLAGNRDFVRAFIDRAVSPAERNAMTAADGSISADGVRRIRFALLARAYGDTELISRISEDTDTNIAAIGKALLDAAPAMARLRAKIEAGEVPAQYDISGNIAEAAQMVSRSRSTGQSIAGMLAQTDAFSDQVSPVTEEVLRVFFRDAEFKRARSGVKVADILNNYAQDAEIMGERAKQGNDMFGNAPTLMSPQEILEGYREMLDGDADAQPDMLTSPPETATTQGDEQTDQPAGQPAGDQPVEGGQDRGAGGAVPVLARGQLRALGIARELQRGQTAALLGRDASTPQELAEIAQIYRDPRVETLRMFFTKGNRIVHATGVSSRMPGEAPLIPDGMRSAEWLAEMRAVMDRSEADGYYLLHNHPSGDPTPSYADISLTRNLAGELPGFKGHVVINSGKYAVIPTKGGQAREYELKGAGPDRVFQPSVPNQLLGMPVTRYDQLAKIAKGLQQPGVVTIIGTDAKGKIRVILDYPASNLKRDRKVLAAMARRIQRQSGTRVMHMVGDLALIDTPAVKRALRGDILTSAIDGDGNNVTPFKSGKKDIMPRSPGRYVAEDAFGANDNADGGGTLNSLTNFLTDPRPISEIYEVGDVLSNDGRIGEVTAANDSSLTLTYRDDGSTEIVPRNARDLEPAKPSEWRVGEDAQSFDASLPEKIDIDGEQRWTVNSNGQPIAKDEAGIRAFYKWFGDSKVVDADGKPLVVYHGTPDGRFLNDDDARFKDEYERHGMKPNVDAHAHWFASTRRMAATYADDTRAFDYQNAEPMVSPVYLAITNPLEINGEGGHWQEVQSKGRGRTRTMILDAKEEGRDGAIVRNVRDDYNNNERAAPGDTFVAFSPTQIKSINNRGTFDPNDARILREERAPFDPAPEIRNKLVDKDGIKRDVELARSIVGNPLKAFKDMANGSAAHYYRSFFYSTDSRLRTMAERFNAPSIAKLADMFHAEAGKFDEATGETYHEAVEREGFGRASRAWRILEPYFDDKAAMNRIGMMLRDPQSRQKGRIAEAKAAAEIAKLLKDTIDYRKAAGEDIGEVTDGYFPRWMDVEKVMAKRDLFLRQATELYRKHGAENPRASAEAWLARIFDQYAGLDGGLDWASLTRDDRPAGVGRSTAKAREFGKDADRLLGEFYNNDTGEVLTSYFIGAARKAEEARRFGGEKMERLMNRIKSEMRKSDEDPGDALDAIARLINTNLGRVDALPEKYRAGASILHTAGQLGTLDRATITSLSEAMMGFVRGGPRYGIPMLKDSIAEFVRQIRGGNRSDAARLAEALGIIEDVMVGDTLASRAGYERSQTTTRAAKVQRGFFRATGLHQWTEGTRTAATRMGQAFIRNNAADALGRNPKRADEALRELGIKNPREFAEWLAEGGDPNVESLTAADASEMHRQYRTALMRFVNQTIMKPTRAQKPRWASNPYGALVFSLMSFSYGFKKNVLDRVGRTGMKAIKDGDPTLLYPAFGLVPLLIAHTVINNVMRQAIFGGGREEDEEGISWIDVMEAIDRAGLTGAASRPLNAMFSLRYRQDPIAAMMGPVIGRPADLGEKVVVNAVGESLGDSPNTNTAERAAAGAIYDVVLEPALEAYGVTRFGGPIAASIVWGSGNRRAADGEAAMVPPDRDWFVDAVAGPKED